MRKKWYIIGYIAAIFILAIIYIVSNVSAEEDVTAVFAVKDLPPGTIVKEGDVEQRNGTVLASEKEQLINKNIEALVGLRVQFGIRSYRPVLVSDLTEQLQKLHEIKLVGDITIPEDAKVVNVIIIYDERNYPGYGKKVLAENVPVKEIYNNQNIPINMNDSKMNKVPKAITLYVTESQMDAILSNKNKGTLYFTTMP